MWDREKNDLGRGSNCFQWGGSSDGDFDTKVSLPTLSLPIGEFQQLAQRKGEGKASEGEEAGSPRPHTLQLKDRNCTQKGI